MPIDPDSFGVMKDLFAEIEDSVDTDFSEGARDAREFFREEMGKEYDGAEVDTLGDPGVYLERDRDLISMSRSTEYAGNPVYGLDSSTTRSQKYRNGLMVSAANAVCSIVHGENTDIESKNTIVASVFHDSSDGSIDHLEDTENGIESHLVPIKDRSVNQPERLVQMTARTKAEGRHAERVSKEIDGPLFLDGGIYPTTAVHQSQLTKAHAGNSSERVKRSREAVQHYIDAVANAVDRGYPVVGVTKTFSSTRVVSSLEKRAPDSVDIRWLDDQQFLEDVLYTAEPQHLSFISWMKRTYSEAKAEEVEPFGGFDIPDGYEPSDFRHAFFFVRIPEGVVFRVETPLMLVQDREDREELQAFILGRLAMTNDYPLSVKRSDSRARIGRETRERLLSIIGGEEDGQITHYNQDVRFEGVEI